MEKKQYHVIESGLLMATVKLLNELPIRMSDEVKPLINALVLCPRVDINEEIPEESKKMVPKK
jgi:hypothetical protein